MDFSKIENSANEGAWIDIEFPGVEESGVRFKILGKDSDAYRDKQKAIMDRRIKNRKMKITADDVEEEGLSLLAACVIEWEGVEKGDLATPCNYSNVREMLANPDYSFVKDQVDEAVGDRANFLKFCGKP